MILNALYCSKFSMITVSAASWDRHLSPHLYGMCMYVCDFCVFVNLPVHVYLWIYMYMSAHVHAKARGQY